MLYFLRSFIYGVIILMMLLDSAEAAKLNLDRTVEKIASTMLREYPDLKAGARTNVARAALVEEFRSLKADEISRNYLRKIRRQKVDYSSLSWTDLVKRFEKANFQDSKRKYLLARAKSQKMRSEEFYVLTRLLKSYYESAIEERRGLSKGRLRRVGRAYTIYARENKAEPQSLEQFVDQRKDRYCLDPYTGQQKEWIFVAANKYQIRGANRHRIVVYSPFKSGNFGAMRWVGYKGGVVGQWKETTLIAAVSKMDAELLKLAEAKKRKENTLPEKKKKTAKATNKVVKPKKLKISIKELW